MHLLLKFWNEKNTQQICVYSIRSISESVWLSYTFLCGNECDGFVWKFEARFINRITMIGKFYGICARNMRRVIYWSNFFFAFLTLLFVQNLLFRENFQFSLDLSLFVVSFCCCLKQYFTRFLSVRKQIPHILKLYRLNTRILSIAHICQRPDSLIHLPVQWTAIRTKWWKEAEEWVLSNYSFARYVHVRSDWAIEVIWKSE